MVIDLFGLTENEVKRKFPDIYQHVLLKVKPEREQNRRKSRREKLGGYLEPNPKLRENGG
ncbi:MAG: hypothetical protein H6667_00590 [Ardenticatenaceae bacterium]|nr:hypothetical protein [Ardenticatenaceae bacterium]